MLAFALLVLSVSVIVRVTIDLVYRNDQFIPAVLESIRYNYLDDVVGVAVGLLTYGFLADGLLDIELLKDLALGYLIATKSFQYVFVYVYPHIAHLANWVKQKC